jgi:hypothetical protein
MNAPTCSFELPLPVLREDNPRDFLAALGLLRLVDLLWPSFRSQLVWSGAEHVPALCGYEQLPDDWPDELLNALKELTQTPTNPLMHGEIIKANYQVFRDAVNRAVVFSTSGHRLAKLPAILYACYSSQITSEGGEVEPSGFSFGNGQSGKKLLLDVRQLIDGMTPSDLIQTLMGMASPVTAKSLRWNPVEFRPAAYRNHDPGSKQKGDETKDHPALNILAFFGLTFYPTVPSASGGKTVGILRQNGEDGFLWPIWSDKLSVDEIASLVCAGPGEWIQSRGITTVWRSKRFSSDKSLYFAPAELFR